MIIPSSCAAVLWLLGAGIWLDAQGHAKSFCVSGMAKQRKGDNDGAVAEYNRARGDAEVC